MDFQYYFEKPLYQNISRLHLLNEFDTNPLLSTLVLLVGPSGSGKDTVLERLLQNGVCAHVMTASSRRKRYTFVPGLDDQKRKEISKDLEAARTLVEYLRRLAHYAREGFIDMESDSYHWMRFKKPGESETAYFKSLVKEYNLLEYDVHHGQMYGLPVSGLEKAAQGTKMPIIRTEIAGVRTIREKLKGKYNIIVIGILPDSWDIVEEKIRERVDLSGKTDENPQMRIEESRKWVEQYPEVVNLVLRNSFEEGGLDAAVLAMESLLRIVRV